MDFIQKYVAWTSDGGGGALVGIPKVEVNKLRLCSVQIVPGANGDLITALPDADYNAYILDEYEQDLLSGEGMARSGTVSEIMYANPAIPITTELFIYITDAGVAKQGIIRLNLYV